MSRDKRTEDMPCENCLHYRACLVNSEYVPTPCCAYEDKAGYRKQSEVENIQEIITELSEIRAGYNLFDENEQPKYHALSVAIQVLNEMKGGE